MVAEINSSRPRHPRPCVGPRPAAPLVAPALAEFRRTYAALLLSANALRAALERSAGELADIPADIGAIQIVVCTHYRLTAEQLTGRARTSDLARPRLIALALCHALTAHPTTTIGRAFGRDHGLVLYASKAVANWADTDPEFARRFSGLRDLAAMAVAASASTL